MLRDWLLVAHITAAIVYVGTDLLLTAFIYRARQSGAVAEFLRTVETAGPFSAIGAVLLLLSGIALVLVVSGISITTLFVLIGLTVIIASGASESVYFGRQVAVLGALVDAPESAAEVRRRMTQLLVVAGVLDLLKLVTVWAMVFKPGL